MANALTVQWHVTPIMCWALVKTKLEIIPLLIEGMCMSYALYYKYSKTTFAAIVWITLKPGILSIFDL